MKPLKSRAELEADHITELRGKASPSHYLCRTFKFVMISMSFCKFFTTGAKGKKHIYRGENASLVRRTT